MLRIEQWKGDHSTEHLGFKPGIDEGDPDFGMLYVSVGDGGSSADDPDPFRKAQDKTSVWGSILRIDPLTDGEPGYVVPDDNPFVGDPAALDEIWAYGLRNPQRFSWDEGPDGKLLIADIGQANIEEINLGIAGANYGWREREGTFVLDPDDPAKVLPVPDDDARFGFTYPVAQYDHDVSLVDRRLAAITGGFVYRGNRLPDLVGQYLFADLVSGRVFYVPVDQLIAGRQATFKELILTEDGRKSRLLDIIGKHRVDLRFGQDEDGEIYLLTKQDGMIRTLGIGSDAQAARNDGRLNSNERQRYSRVRKSALKGETLEDDIRRFEEAIQRMEARGEFDVAEALEQPLRKLRERLPE